MRTLTAAALLLLVAAPALAQWRPAGFGSPRSPCDHYVPTGETLPREDVADGRTVIYGGPTWGGGFVGSTVAGDRITVLQECGNLRRIRTSEGLEGWLHVVSLPNEARLQREAQYRKPASNQECELRFETPSMVENCEVGVKQRQARADELAHSTYIASDAMPGFVSGKTFELVSRNTETGDADNDDPPLLVYFQPNGESFSMMQGQSETRARSRWLIDHDHLCLPNDNNACGRFRHTSSGRTIWASDGGIEFLATLHDGDSDNLVPQVREVFPYAEPPLVPQVLAGIAHPAMGW